MSTADTQTSQVSKYLPDNN